MSKALELREQRASIIGETRRLLDANPTLDSQTQEQYDTMMVDIDSLAEQVKTEERKEHQSKLEAELVSTKRETRTAPHRIGVNAEADERRSFNCWLRKRAGLDVSSNDLDGNQYYNPFQSEIEIRTGLTVGNLTAAGYLAPTLFPTNLERILKYFCNLRQFC